MRITGNGQSAAAIHGARLTELRDEVNEAEGVTDRLAESAVFDRERDGDSDVDHEVIDFEALASSLLVKLSERAETVIEALQDALREDPEPEKVTFE